MIKPGKKYFDIHYIKNIAFESNLLKKIITKSFTFARAFTANLKTCPGIVTSISIGLKNWESCQFYKTKITSFLKFYLRLFTMLCPLYVYVLSII